MLHRKLFRDIRENWVSWTACVAIVTIALASFLSMMNVRDILTGAMNAYYRDYGFGDVFAEVVSMPAARLESLERIPGIRSADGKLIRDARVVMPGREDNVSVRLISVDETGRDALNRVWLVDGAMPEPGERSVLLGVEFYDLNRFVPGGTLTVVIDGRREDLVVSGKGQTPEYIYVMKNESDFLPSGDAFGAAYMQRDAMESLFGAQGEVNALSFRLEPGVSFDDVKDALRLALEPYTLGRLMAAKDQISNNMLSQEIGQLSRMAYSLPIVFLTVSSIILWIMLKRMTEHQRTQIGMLKAAGFTAWEVMRHYLAYPALVAVAGGLLGNLSGGLLSGAMTVMYRDYFTLPGLVNRFSPGYFAAGMGLSILFAMLAGLLGARSVLRLAPAVAMQPPSPHEAHRVPLERIAPFWAMLTVQGRMAVRNIFRNRGRSFFTMAGISLSFAMMASIFSFTEMADIFILDPFENSLRYDLKVLLEKPMDSGDVLGEISRRDGVLRAEPLLEAPCTLTFGHREKSTVVIAASGDSQLYHVADEDGRPINIPKDGIVLAEPLARRMGVTAGDIVTFDSPYMDGDERDVTVVRLVPQYIGSSAYMTRETLLRLLGQGDIATSVLLRTDPALRGAIREALLEGAGIEAIEDVEQVKGQYGVLLDQMFAMIWVMVAMVIVVAFAIVYNSSMVSLSERERELASLRVLGMDLGEVQQVLSFEQNFLSGIGVAFGVPLTYGLYRQMASSMETELYSIPIVINVEMFLMAFLGIAGSLALSWLSIRRRLRRLDMVEVLKARE